MAKDAACFWTMSITKPVRVTADWASHDDEWWVRWYTPKQLGYRTVNERSHWRRASDSEVRAMMLLAVWGAVKQAPYKARIPRGA